MLKKIVASSRLVHNLVSYLVNLLPDFFEHNLSKYKMLKKCIYNLNYDQVEGSYCEFGCFTGAALNHTIKTHIIFSKSKKKSENYLNRFFYGFDSFEGFPEEVHNEYKSSNFKTNYEEVKKLENQYKFCKVVKGFFSNSLSRIEIKNNKELDKIALAFIDCDIYSSAQEVFNFIKNKMSNGSFVIIDDYYNIDKNGKSIHAALLETGNLYNNLSFFSSYGYNGIVYKYFKYE